MTSPGGMVQAIFTYMKKHPWSGLYISIVALVGLAVFCATLGIIATSLDSQSWPSVTGVILSSKLTSTRGTRGGEYYDVAVQYQYQVAGRSFTGNTVSFSDTSTSVLDQAQAELAQYHPGAQVAVFYNPSGPDQSVLQKGITSNFWWNVGSFALITAFAAWQVIFFIRYVKKHTYQERTI